MFSTCFEGKRDQIRDQSEATEPASPQWTTVPVFTSIQHYRNEFNRNAQEKREAQEAAANEERSKRKQRLVAELGSKNAAARRVRGGAVKRVTDSEAGTN
jgi:hypothetical protein